MLSAVSPTTTTAGPKALEARLIAPCCWNGTLDMHDSELAQQLRAEIEQRWSHGETAETIQGDLVGRYGSRLVAASSDAPIRDMTVILSVLLVALAVALGFLVRRWTRREAVTMPAARDELDLRIDDELRELG